MSIKLCDIPGCPFHGRYCRNHYPGDTPKAPATIPKVSAKRKEENKEYKKVAEAVKKSGDGKCQINSPACIKSPVHPQHLVGRIGKRLTDRKKMIRACNPCNSYVEKHPTWAKANGFALPKHEKNYKRSK